VISKPRPSPLVQRMLGLGDEDLGIGEDGLVLGGDVVAMEMAYEDAGDAGGRKSRLRRRVQKPAPPAGDDQTALDQSAGTKT